MKRILLTSTALVAFAGAASAGVSLSGSAEFSYNSITGFGSDTSITASASQELNNGYTASVSFTIDPEAAADEITVGTMTVSNDTSSISYHGDPGTGVGAAYIGTGASSKMTDNGVNFGSDDPHVNKASEITASTMLGGATIRASLDGTDFQIGVSTDLGGTSLDAGFDDATDSFGVQLGGEASGVSYTLGFDSAGAYGLNASTTAAGADITLDFGDLGWEVGASMPLGVATVGVTLDDTSAWEVSIDTSLEGMDLGFTFDSASAWTMSAGYTMDAVSIAFSTDNTSAWAVDADYDMGNGITVGAGTSAGDGNYVDVGYDLGNGAAAAIQYGSVAAAGPDDIAEGTTIKVSFEF